MEIPVRERLRLEPAMLPTGEREPVRVAPGRLGARTFDDAYVAPPDGAAFVLEGGGRRIELAFETGYPFAQVFAPAGRRRDRVRADDRAGQRAGRRRVPS